MCTFDTGMFGQWWVKDIGPFVDFNTEHRCKNFDDLRDWVRARVEEHAATGRMVKMCYFPNSLDGGLIARSLSRLEEEPVPAWVVANREEGAWQPKFRASLLYTVLMAAVSRDACSGEQRTHCRQPDAML